jgi:hypothetical protein
LVTLPAVPVYCRVTHADASHISCGPPRTEGSSGLGDPSSCACSGMPLI